MAHFGIYGKKMKQIIKGKQTDSLEERVYALEETLPTITTLLQQLKKLKNEYNEDIDGDGHVG